MVEIVFQFWQENQTQFVDEMLWKGDDLNICRQYSVARINVKVTGDMSGVFITSIHIKVDKNTFPTPNSTRKCKDLYVYYFFVQLLGVKLPKFHVLLILITGPSDNFDPVGT